MTILITKLCRSAALFLLTSKDDSHNQLLILLHSMVALCRRRGEKYLINKGLELDVSKCFKDLRNPFKDLETEYMQNKFYEEKFKLIVSFRSAYMVM